MSDFSRSQPGNQPALGRCNGRNGPTPEEPTSLIITLSKNLASRLLPEAMDEAKEAEEKPKKRGRAGSSKEDAE